MLGPRLYSEDIYKVYELNGNFISKIGKFGKSELELDWSYSLTIDESNGNIYVNDYINNCIQILSQDLLNAQSYRNPRARQLKILAFSILRTNSFNITN